MRTVQACLWQIVCFCSLKITFILLSSLKDSCTKDRILGWWFLLSVLFFFHHFKGICFLASIVWDDTSICHLYHYFLVCNVFLWLFLYFISLIMMCLGMVLFVLLGVCWTYWNCRLMLCFILFFTKFEKFWPLFFFFLLSSL